MNLNKIKSHYRTLLTGMMSLVLNAIIISGVVHAGEYGAQHENTSRDGVVHFIGNGRITSVDGGIMVDGLIDGNGERFFQEVLDFNSADVEDYRQDAIEFFAERFGVDAEEQDGFIFTGYEVNPGINLRAYSVSGVNVPEEGWVVEDGGFGVFVTNPEGITLGGDWDGFVIPVGSVLFYGDYVIQASTKQGNPRPFRISYKSDIPFMADQFGAGQIRCQVTSEEFGGGGAGGIARFVPMADGRLQLDVRNVISFPGVLNGTSGL